MTQIIAIGIGRANKVFKTQKECMEELDISPKELFQAMAHGYAFKGYYFDELFEKDDMENNMKENKNGRSCTDADKRREEGILRQCADAGQD